MRDVLQTVGTVALLVGVILLPLDLKVGCSLLWQGVFAFAAGSQFWWREETAIIDD